MNSQLTYKGDIRNGQTHRHQDFFHERTYNEFEWMTIDFISSLQAFQDKITDLKCDYDYLMDCDEQLSKEVWHIILTEATANQTDIALRVFRGQTQKEIAKALGGISQPTIVKALQGNVEYISGKKKRHGGLRKIIVKNVLINKPIQKLMKEMNNIGTEGCRLPFYQSLRRHCFYSSLHYEMWLQEKL
jgi:hypothetical protein